MVSMIGFGSIIFSCVWSILFGILDIVDDVFTSFVIFLSIIGLSCVFGIEYLLLISVLLLSKSCVRVALASLIRKNVFG